MHPQVEILKAEILASLDVFPMTQATRRAFWEWYPRAVSKKQCPPLPDPPQSGDHVLDKLQVLELADSEESVYLSERKRSLQISVKGCEKLAKGLLACKVLLVQEYVTCPSMERPDAVVRALAHAQKSRSHLKLIEEEIEPVRSVLEKLTQTELPEATEVASKLPVFRSWGGGVGFPDKSLMPPLTSALRIALQEVKLDALDEEDHASITSLLHRMNTPQLNPVEVAKQALQQSKKPVLLAELLRANLSEAFHDVEIFLSASGKLLKPTSCLLWDAEQDFPLIPQRLDAEVFQTHFEGLKQQLKMLGCRTELDQRDVLDLAEQIQTSKDLVLAKKLLKRLESHPHMNEICSSPDLRCIQWLPASTKNKQEELLAPTQVWQPRARALVDLVKPLVTADASGRLLDALGVQGECHVTDAILHQQLAAMVEAKAEAEMVSPIYKRLQTIPPLEKWVWTKSGFQPLDRISTDVEVEHLSPCLHRLREEWHALPVFERANQKLTPELVFKCLDMTLDTSLNVAAHAVHQVRVSAVNLLTKHRAFDGSEPDLADLASKCGSNLRMITRSGNLLPVENTFSMT